MRGQHKNRWEQFKVTVRDSKAAYFQRNAPVRHASTIPCHFAGKQTPLQLHKANFDYSIGALLLDQDDDDGLTNAYRERALRFFQEVDPTTVQDPQLAETKYEIYITTPRQFNLVAKFLSTGVSFR